MDNSTQPELEVPKVQTSQEKVTQSPITPPSKTQQEEIIQPTEEIKIQTPVTPIQQQKQQKVEAAEEKLPAKYQNAPKRLRRILLDAISNDKLSLMDIDLSKLGYEKKITGNNFCSHFFAAGVQKYYVCQQCSFSLGGYSTMCYCEGCFDADRHIGHNTYSQIPYSDRAYCDCGRVQRFKKQSFCAKHQGFEKQIACEIPQQVEKQYIQCFSYLIQLAIQSRDEEFIQKIGSKLQQLNQNSVFYNRMSYKLFISKSITADQKFKGEKYFFIFPMLRFDFEKLLIHLGGDIRTRINFIKLFSQVYGQDADSKYMDGFSSSNFRELVNITTVQRLLQQQYYSDFIYKSIESEQSVKKRPQLLTKLLFIKVKTLKELKQLQIFQNHLIQEFTPQLAQRILTKIGQLYPSSDSIRKFINGESDQNNPWANIQQIQNKQQSAQNLPHKVKITNKVFIKTISALIVHLDLAKDIRSYIVKRCIPEQKIQEIIYWLTVTAKQLLIQQEEQHFGLIALLLLIRNSPSKIQQIQNLWKFLLKKNIPEVQQGQEESYTTNIPYLADTFHFLITVLFRADIFCIMEKKKVFKGKKSANKTSEDSQSKALQTWFRSFLYEKKTVSRSQIIELRKSGVLSFDGAGKILNEVCSYNQDQQIFNFSHTTAFKNIVNEFPLIPTQQNYQALYTNTIHFGQTIQLQQGSLASDLLNQVLTCKTIIPSFQQQWERTCKHGQYLEDEIKNGYLYLFVLVVYDILTKGANQSLRSKLEQIRQNESLLSFYSMREQDTNIIKRLLNIQKKQQMQSAKIESHSEKKTLAQEKKKKIAEKFKKTRQLVLEKIKSQTEGQVIDDNQETCILCHEKQKKDNYLVYLSSINKNNTICGSVHGKNNISNTYISTCFHSIHVNCFIDYRKNTDFSFSCPLCQAQCNCIIPTSYDPENKKLNRICQNAMIACMVTTYRIYDVQSDFILIFKHLVESKGLNSLLQETRYEQKKKLWLKKDQFLFQLMDDIYNHSGQEAKARHLKSIQDFAAEIETCTKLQSKLVQLLFVEALKAVLTSSTNLQNIIGLLLKIRALIKQEQFSILQDQLHEILHEDLKQLPEQTQEEKNQAKTSLGFSLFRLPQRADECQKYFADKKCQICTNSNGQYQCLMCGNISCQNCRQEHFSSTHNQAAIFFVIGNYRVQCLRKSFYSNDDIYLNEFKLSYSQKNDYYEQYQMQKSEDYLLNGIKFQKIVSKFLEN